MRTLENFAELIFPLIISSVVAVLAAIVAFVAVLGVGARFFSGETSYGVGLGFGPPAAVVTAVLTFAFVFRKMR